MTFETSEVYGIIYGDPNLDIFFFRQTNYDGDGLIVKQELMYWYFTFDDRYKLFFLCNEYTQLVIVQPFVDVQLNERLINNKMLILFELLNAITIYLHTYIFRLHYKSKKYVNN